jgi:CRISPR-associated protein Cmr5
MRAIDKYLKDALKQANDLAENNKKAKHKIPKRYKGYVASFGTILKQSGLTTAFVLFLKNSEKDEADRKPILEAIFKILKNNKQLGIPEAFKEKQFAENYQQDQRMRQEVLNAAVALKIAMRTFEFDDNE